MATSESDSTGIGKNPESVDEEQPGDDELREFLDSQESGSSENVGESEPPTRSELWEVVQQQSEQIEGLQDRVNELEAQINNVEQEADTIEEVAEQFKNGKIGGEPGADFIREFVTVPMKNTKLCARSKKLFFKIIKERMVGQPITTTRVIDWLHLQDSTNPSVKAKRIMDRLERHRDDGYLLGTIETGKYRGQNAIWLKRE